MQSRLKDTLLLVGDASGDRPVLRTVFEDTYHLLEAENLPQAALLLEQNGDCIAAVLVDLEEIRDEDVKLVNRAAHWGDDNEIPILSLICAADDGKREELAFARGASDVIIKPYTPASIRRRVQVLVDLHLHKWRLQSLVDEQDRTIRTSNQIMLDALSSIIEHRNTESGNHILRIRRFTKILLEEAARIFEEYGLTRDTIDIITGAAAFHDIGKISIPDAILNKPGKLTPEEYEVMKTHTTLGAELIRSLSDMGNMAYLRYAYNIALYHHERWDGKGYPEGLVGDDTPICAQAVALADVFDALITPRVYKPAFPCDQAVNMILNGECGLFSPKLLVCFKNVRHEMMELAQHYADGYSPKDDNIAAPLPGPDPANRKMSAAQISFVKYQTMLHYSGDTVLELDMNAGLYHVIYNPDPALEHLQPSASGTGSIGADILWNIRTHPGDASVTDEIRRLLDGEFFRRNLRRKTFSLRISDPADGEYRKYELSLLRVDTGNEQQRILLAVFHRTFRSHEHRKTTAERKTHHETPSVLHGLAGTILCCRNDRELTVSDGAGNLLSLTGYTEREIRAKFDGKLLNMILPADRTGFLEAMDNQRKAGGGAETEFRLLCRHGKTLWVRAKSRFFEEAGGEEAFWLVLSDNSRAKAVEEDLRSAVERNRIIVDQLGGIVFEWDMLTDTMICSPSWQERFGYPPLSRDFSRQMEIASHFHPDDLKAIRTAIGEIRSGGGAQSLDVRIADSAAKYRWMRIAAVPYFDEEERMTRIIGILQDIDVVKRAELSLKDQASRDALTGLLNKGSAQQKIRDYLTGRPKDSIAAMILLDMDNFKTVNDTYGHLYGDTVLTALADQLKKLFRVYDVLARTGGDEFMIFVHDLPNEEVVRQRCERVLETVRTVLEGVAPGMHLSCSIGVSLVPAHGTGYTDLFLRADEALYRSKARGKNTCVIYDPKDRSTEGLRGNTRTVTRIDSDRQPGMADASFVHYVVRRLASSTDILQTLDEILAYVGEQLKVSRVYIFENNEDNTSCSNTFEWCNEEISPEKDNLQNVSYVTDIPGWPDLFNEQGIFYCTDIGKLEERYRKILEPQNIRSMLQCSIRDGGVFRGYVGFDECHVNRLWTQPQIDMLQSLAEILSMFLLKKRTQDRIAHESQNLQSILDRQDILLYVVDPDTCELKFLNKKIRKQVPESRVGQTCHKALHGRQSRCENCPAAQIHREKNASAPVAYPGLDVPVRTNASEIRWNEQDACLIFCQEPEADGGA